MPDLIFILDMARATWIVDKTDDEDVDVDDIEVKDGDEKAAKILFVVGSSF